MTRAFDLCVKATATTLVCLMLVSASTFGQVDESASAVTALPTRPSASARELLVNVDESDLNHFIDRQPLDANDEETLDRILYRLPAIRLDSIERIARTEPNWTQLADDPGSQRAECFRLTGRVTAVARQELLPEVAARLEFDHYFRVTLELDDAPNPVVICARKVPQAWLHVASLRERASAYGLFIKVGDVSGQHPQLVFAALRVAWHPDHEDQALDVSPERVLLGDLGFDVGLLDEVRQTNYREITSADRESFYQMLTAVGRADPAQLMAGAKDEFSLIDLLRAPRQHHGQLARLSGIARRVTKILVDDRDIQQRFQLDHYYQIDMFLLLGDRVIRMDSTGTDKKGPQYSRIYPVTVCVRRLPAGLTEGSDLRQEVRMPAFFYKLWSYKSEYVSAIDKSFSQRSPLFLAVEPEVVPQKPVNNPIANVAITVLCATFAILCLGYWRQSRRRAKSGKDAVSRLSTAPEKSLDELQIEVQDKPDFSQFE